MTATDHLGAINTHVCDALRELDAILHAIKEGGSLNLTGEAHLMVKTRMAMDDMRAIAGVLALLAQREPTTVAQYGVLETNEPDVTF